MIDSKNCWRCLGRPMPVSKGLVDAQRSALCPECFRAVVKERMLAGAGDSERLEVKVASQPYLPQHITWADPPWWRQVALAIRRFTRRNVPMPRLRQRA